LPSASVIQTPTENPKSHHEVSQTVVDSIKTSKKRKAETSEAEAVEQKRTKVADFTPSLTLPNTQGHMFTMPPLSPPSYNSNPPVPTLPPIHPGYVPQYRSWTYNNNTLHPSKKSPQRPQYQPPIDNNGVPHPSTTEPKSQPKPQPQPQPELSPETKKISDASLHVLFTKSC
jgi:hypothetical protein